MLASPDLNDTELFVGPEGTKQIPRTNYSRQIYVWAFSSGKCSPRGRRWGQAKCGVPVASRGLTEV